MSTFNWQDVLMDEDNGLPVPPAKENLPDDNEGKPELETQDFPAAGDLPEDETDPGMKDVPRGKDPVTGLDSKEYDDVSAFLDADDTDASDDEAEDKGEKGDEKEDNASDDEASEGEEASDGEAEDEAKKKETDSFIFDDFLFDEEGGLPVPAPKEDLPSDNEGQPEKETQGQPAAGDLPEDDTDPGMKDVPRGKDPITGLNPGDYDDIMNILVDKKDGEDEEDESSDDDEEDEDKKKKKEQGEGSDDDGASKDGDTEGDNEDIKDFRDFFVDADTEIPDGPEGSKLEPADPVDGKGDDVCPIGDPDLPSTLTEPVIVPSDDPDAAPATKDQLMDLFREDVRFSFGDF